MIKQEIELVLRIIAAIKEKIKETDSEWVGSHLRNISSKDEHCVSSFVELVPHVLVGKKFENLFIFSYLCS